MDEIAIYDIDVLEDENGISKISFVSNPAFERNFVFYNNHNVNYTVIDKEERIVFGPLIIADTLVLRDNPPKGVYYARFTPDAIKRIAIKYFQDKNINEYNVYHKTDIDGVYLTESVFKSDIICPRGYEDLPNGTWFVGFYIENDDLWNEIKNGSFKGFSMEMDQGYVDTNQVVDIKPYLTQTNYSKIGKMSKKSIWGEVENAKRKVASKLKAKVGKIVYSSITGKRASDIVMYETVSTDKGELALDGYITVDKQDITLNAEGQDPQLAPAGNYVLQTDDERNGRILTIVNTDDGSNRIESYTDESGNAIEMESTSNEMSTTDAFSSDEKEVLIETAAKVEQHAEAIDSLSDYYGEHIDKFKDQVAELTDQLTELTEYCKKEIGNIKKEIKLPSTIVKKEVPTFSAPTNYESISTEKRVGSKRYAEDRINKGLKYGK